jgi:hypothetical protein
MQSPVDLAVAPASMAAGTLARIARAWHSFVVQLLDPYRPEVHYMRGPGPKCHEKHAREIGSGVVV